MPLSNFTGLQFRQSFTFAEATKMIMFKQLRCSFCRKKDSEVLKLVAGPHVYICDRSVAIANELMNNPPTDKPPPTVRTSVWHEFVARIGHFIRGRNTLRAGSLVVS